MQNIFLMDIKLTLDYALSCLKAAYDQGQDGLFYVILMEEHYLMKLAK